MNLIKLKDVKAPSHLSWAPYFNRHLKGKYAYWIQMRYIVSFDHMKHEGYVACEEDIYKLLQRPNGEYPKPYGAPCLDVYDMDVVGLIDTIETDRINSTIEFRMKNNYVSDEDVTEDEVRMFRQWLAVNLLLMDQMENGRQKYQFFTEMETHVLNYYANNMYDGTIKILNNFGGLSVKVENVEKSCACMSGGTDISSLYGSSISTCDAITIYRDNIYKKMVEMFKEIDFWTRWPKEFIVEFKKYIDNIIRLNLPFEDTYKSDFEDCCCHKEANNDNINVLNRLSQALQYIKDEDVRGHKNYIKDALYDWSSRLYEKMMWV